jgi:amidohydrolase
MKEWFALIDDNRIVRDRRYLHQHPELSGQEFTTADYIEKQLADIGVSFFRPVPTGVAALIDGRRPGKTLIIRADTDALPMQDEIDKPYRSEVKGVAHTCGHDAHTAMLLETARVLGQLKDDLCGKVMLVFQPSEEVSEGGALSMVESGMLGTPDAALALHMKPDMPAGYVGIREEGAVTTASDSFYISIMGKGGHGAMPDQAVDPIVVGAEIVTALQTVVSRICPPGETNVLTVGSFHGGSAYNIIPGEVTLSGSMRTVSEAGRSLVRKALERIVRNVCAAHRASCLISVVPIAPAVFNDAMFSNKVRQSAENALGEDHVSDAKLSPASEDFSQFGALAPLCLVWLGGGEGKDGFGYANHHPKFDIDERALVAGVKLEVQTALDFCAEPAGGR